ncbi:MAG: nucleoside hydrolase [Pseudomonadota bacterium]
MPRRIFIDTDTASDDAVALMMAFTHVPDALVGISIVAGNVPLQQGIQNALFTRELFSASTPIFAGAAKPLSRPLETAQFVHGDDGMADIGLDLSGREPDEGDGIQALIDAADQYPGELELITLGPLTNIALALERDSELATKIKHCTIMGGASDGYGNVTPVSEFNLWADPEAAEIVFASPMPKTMVGWDISRKFAVIDDQDADELRAIGTPVAKIAVDSQATVRKFCEESSGFQGFDLPDPIAMAVVISEKIIVADKSAAVTVMTHDGPTRGLAIIDDRHFSDRQQSTRVILEADREHFLTLLRTTLS